MKGLTSSTNIMKHITADTVNGMRRCYRRRWRAGKSIRLGKGGPTSNEEIKKTTVRSYANERSEKHIRLSPRVLLRSEIDMFTRSQDKYRCSPAPRIRPPRGGTKWSYRKFTVDESAWVHGPRAVWAEGVSRRAQRAAAAAARRIRGVARRLWEAESQSPRFKERRHARPWLL